MGRATIDLMRKTEVKDEFQSTPSVGRATGGSNGVQKPLSAFQSTPSVGRATIIDCLNKVPDFNFNPRPPWGGRPWWIVLLFVVLIFQSTPSVGRATPSRFLPLICSAYFNPRPPWGGRLARDLYHSPCHFISIHALRGEGDVVFVLPAVRFR